MIYCKGRDNGTVCPNLSRWAADVFLAATLFFLSVSVLFAAESAPFLKIGGTGCALGGIKEVAVAFQKKHPEISIRIIPSLGSGGGIRAALAGSLDIALSARPLTDHETAAGASAIEYARTPFAFVTASVARERSITLLQAAAIYSGEMLEWPDHTPIRLIIRPESDTDTVLLKEMSPAMEKAVRRALSREGMLVAITDQENADLLAKVKGAFGAATLSQLVSEKLPLRALSLDGVQPSLASLAGGTYPYFKVYFAVTGPRSSPAAKRFVDFLFSPEGRAVLTRTGHLVMQGAR